MFDSRRWRLFLGVLLVFTFATSATDVDSEADRPKKKAARGIHAHRRSQNDRAARSYAISASSSIEEEMLRDTELPARRHRKKGNKKRIAEEKRQQDIAKKLLWEREENDLLRQELDAIHELRRQGLLDQNHEEDDAEEEEDYADNDQEHEGAAEISADVLAGTVQTKAAVNASENSTANQTGNKTATAVQVQEEVEEQFNYADIRINPNVLLAESRVMKVKGRSVHQDLFDDRSPIEIPSGASPRTHHVHLSHQEEHFRLNSLGKFQDKHHYSITGGNMSLVGLVMLLIGFGFNLLAPTVLGLGKEADQAYD